MAGVALQVDGGAALELGAKVSVAGAIHDGIDIHVAGNVRNEFGAFTGEDVHHASGQVAGGEDFGESGGQWKFFGGNNHRGIATQNSWRDERDQREQGRFIGREHGDDAGRFRGGEIEVRTGYRVYAAEDLRELVRPAGEMDQAVDGCGDFGFRFGGGGAGGTRDFIDGFEGAILEHFGGAIKD